MNFGRDKSIQTVAHNNVNLLNATDLHFQMVKMIVFLYMPEGCIRRGETAKQRKKPLLHGAWSCCNSFSYIFPSFRDFGHACTCAQHDYTAARSGMWTMHSAKISKGRDGGKRIAAWSFAMGGSVERKWEHIPKGNEWSQCWPFSVCPSFANFGHAHKEKEKIALLSGLHFRETKCK